MPSINGAIQRCGAVATALRKGKQGSTDLEAPWSKARCAWATQHVIRLGLLTLENPEPYFNPSNLTLLYIDSISFWDKKHQKVRISGDALGHEETRFPRDSSGAIDLSGNGTCNDARCHAHVKFSQEYRFCTGVAMNIEEDRSKTGHRLPTHDCTMKKIAAIKMKNKLVQEKIKEIKTCDKSLYLRSRLTEMPLHYAIPMKFQ